jgi:uncharacterized membrane protein YkgB
MTFGQGAHRVRLCRCFDTRTAGRHTLTTVTDGALRSALLRWIVSRASEGYSKHARVVRISYTLSRDTTGFLTVEQFSKGLGTVEVIITVLIGLRHWSAKASALGSGLAVLMFLTTLSFVFSTPGWEPSLGGFPALSGSVGQFLVKDVVLLGASIWTLGEAWTHQAQVAAAS